MRKNRKQVVCKKIFPFPATSLYDGLQKTPHGICGPTEILTTPSSPFPWRDVLTNPRGPSSFLSSQKPPSFLQCSKQSEENKPLLTSHFLLRDLIYVHLY